MPEVTLIYESLEAIKTILIEPDAGGTFILPLDTPSQVILAEADTVVLPDNGIGTVVIPDENPGIVVLDNSEPEPPEPPQPVILPTTSEVVVLDDGSDVVVISSDAPGPPGPTGPSGPPGGSSVTRTAAQALSAQRVVKAVAGDAVDYASADQLADAYVVEGITVTAPNSGASVEVQTAGEMTEPTWSWALGPVYCGLNGQLTQTPPSAAWIRQVATAVDTDRIIIGLQPPIITP